MNLANLPSSSAQTLARATYNRLRADVLSGYWEPGSKLLMHELRHHYEVGASPLREALNRLASEQLVVHNDQRGFAVAQATSEQLADLVETRIAVESLALEQCLVRRSTEWEESLVLSYHRLARTARSVRPENFEENPEWERLHRAFHFSLLSGCGSPLLLGFCEQLYDFAYRYRQLAARNAHKVRDVLEEHRVLFESVMAGQLAQAQHLLADHYRRTAGFVCDRSALTIPHEQLSE